MINPKLMEITRKLVLAEKRITGISTIYPSSIVHPLLKFPSLQIPASIPAMQMQPQLLLNLGKLNPFLSDNSIRAIECSGAGKNIKLKKEQMLEVNVQLAENEIFEIINIFANAARMPLMPVMKADFGNLTMNAFISPAMGSKFFIVKK
jgi:hypothetical protein